MIIYMIAQDGVGREALKADIEIILHSYKPSDVSLVCINQNGLWPI